MRLVHLEVPRPVYWRVTTTLDPNDQVTYWRITWHAQMLKHGLVVRRLLAAALPIGLIAAALISASLTDLLLVAVTILFLRWTISGFCKTHQHAADALFDANPEKWSAIRDGVQPLNEAYTIGDPTITVDLYVDEGP